MEKTVLTWQATAHVFTYEAAVVTTKLEALHFVCRGRLQEERFKYAD